MEWITEEAFAGYGTCTHVQVVALLSSITFTFNSRSRFATVRFRKTPLFKFLVTFLRVGLSPMKCPITNYLGKTHAHLRYEISEVTTRRHISVIGSLGVKRGIIIWDFFWFGEVRNQTSHKKLVCPLPSQLMPVELERGLS